MTTDNRNRLHQFDLAAAGFLVLVMLILGFGLSRIETNTEDVMSWLPDQSSARDAYELFQANFASDDFIVLTWPGCTLGNPVLEQLADQIRDSDSAPLIERVITGDEALQRMESELGFQRREAIAALRGVFFGLEDPRRTCLVVELNSQGTDDRGTFMEGLWQTIDEFPGLDRSTMAIGGYPYLANYFDRQIKQAFLKMLVPGIVVATLIAMLCLRNLVLTLIVFATAALAAGCSVAFIPIWGAKLGGLSSIIPILTFVLTISGCLHLIRYNLESIGDPWQLLRTGWKPCAISTSTTAIGMLTLTRSNFPAIRDFGFFCAAGVLFSLAFQLIVIPWLLARLGQPGLQRLSRNQQGSFLWIACLNRIDRHRWWVVTGGMCAIALGLAGLWQLRASVEVDGFFEPGSPVVQGLADLERQLGPLDQTEAIVIFHGADPDDFVQRYRYIRRLQTAWLRLETVDVAHSLLNYLPREPKSLTGPGLVKRTIFRRKLQSQRDSLADGLFLKVSGDREMWRISLRFPFTRQSNFDELAQSVGQVAQAQAVAYAGEHPRFRPPEFLFSGKTFLFHHAQETLLVDLFKNFLLAFLIITPLLIIVLRSVSLGLVAMIPNVMPALLVFGILGWTARPVDLAIAMTASVALGIAVDDTSHFLIRFRDFGGRWWRVSPALGQAIGQCGPAMLHTTLISCAGMLCAYFSGLYVLTRFASTIAMLLVVALLADLFLLPAILLTIDRARHRGKQVTPLENEPVSPRSPGS
ncbi:MAG: MMPL family transporter [Mariniblastus sp.]|nr:MMPL family transporter [Mariniblastus sp.]